MRTEFPAMHASLEPPPRSPDREKRSRNRRAAFATRGVFFVRPKSERTSSLQFVATYFGRYSSNADDPGIVGRTVEKIPQNPETDARVRFLRKEPVAESAAQGHPHLGTGGRYLFPPRDRLRGARCDRVIWAEPFQRASRLSSAWSERVTVECSRARGRGARCHHQAPGSNPGGGTFLRQ